MTIPFVKGQSSPQEIVRAYQELAESVRRLETRFPENVDGWANNQSNVTPDRAFDADSTTVAELADVLGTLISDLIDAGVLK